mgnify:CR=1 FL=1
MNGLKISNTPYEEINKRVYKISEEIEIKEYGLYASRGNTIIPDILKERENKGLKK